MFSTVVAASIRLRTLHVCLLQSLDRSANRVTAADTVTFDAFDTLITRSVIRPIDAFEIVGNQAGLVGLTQLDPLSWARLRVEAEHRCAKESSPEEVTITQIYSRLAKMGGIDEGRLPQAMNVEASVELGLSSPIASTAALFQRTSGAGKQVAVLSDTYLKKSDLVALLLRSCPRIRSSDVYPSSETRATKRSGALFEVFAKRYSTRSRRILHIGDNLASDVLRARKAGYDTAPFTQGKPNRYEKVLASQDGANNVLGSAMAGSARAARLSKTFEQRHLQTIWNVSCSVTGPLLFTFLAWILREATARKLRRLYFLSRDGEILLKIARILLPAHAALDTRYLYVSRTSLHPAAIGRLSREDLRSLRVRAGDTLGSVLDKIDLTKEKVSDAEVASLGGLTRETLLTPALIDDLCAGIKYQPLHERISTHAARLRGRLRSYLSQEGLLAQEKVGIVDIGWSGRLQRSIVHACLGLDSFEPAQLVGFYFGLVSKPEGSGDFLSLTGTPEGQWLKRIIRETLFEAFCAAHHGTVTGYTSNAAPKLLTEDNSEAIKWGLDVQQQGIVSFATMAAKTFQLASIDPSEHVPALLARVSAAVQMFIRTPSQSEAVTFGDFLHSESSLHNSFSAIAPPLRLRPRSLIRRLKGEREIPIISDWPEASITRTFPRCVSHPLLAVLRVRQSFRS